MKRIFLLVVLLLLITPASAASYKFKNGTATFDGWLGTKSFDQASLSYGMPEEWMIVGQSSVNPAIAPDHTQINYVGFTGLYAQEYYSGPNYLISYDSTGAYIRGDIPVAAHSDIDRIECQWNGTYWNFYKGGNLVDWGATSTQAYYIGISGGFDNVVVTGTGPLNLIQSIGANWYVRKDMLDPTLAGLHSEYDNLVSSNTMHSTWALSPILNGGSWKTDTWTVTTKHSVSGAIIDVTTIPASAIRTGAGNLTYNLTEMLFNSAAPYGLYTQTLTRNGAIEDIDTFWYTSTGATIAWDKDEYSIGDAATITTDVSAGYWDTGTYTYSGKIINLYGEVMDTWSITSQTQTEDIDLTGYAVGDYYATIIASSGGTDYYMAFDIASVEDVVNIEGLTLNALTASLLSGPWVNMTQIGTWDNETASGGIYNKTGFYEGAAIGVYGAHPGFNHSAFSWTPPETASYNITLSFIPNVLGGSTGSSAGSIVGIVREDWSHNPIPGATVRISNATFTGITNTTNAAGYYEFHELAAGTSYTINATATGYDQSVDYSRSPIAGDHIIQNIDMTPEYILGVECRDEENNALITDPVQVSSSDGQSVITTSGIAQFTLDFGAYEITGSTEGYYVASRAVLMTGDRNITLSFTRQTDTSGAAAAGAAALHSVKFMVRDSNGLPIADCAVSAIGIETSVGPWTWLLSILGLSWTETPIHNQTMSGTTDFRGEINFLMLPIVQYNMTFFKAGYINKNIHVYPKDDEYLIVADAAGKWLVNGSDVNTYINWTISYEAIDSQRANVTVSYRDNLSHTTSMRMNLTRTNASGAGYPEVLLDGWTWTGSGGHIITHSFTVYNHTGLNNSVWSRNRAVTPDFGTVFKDLGITFLVPGPLAPMGLPSQVLFFVSVFILFLVGMVFGATSVSVGALVVCVTAWLLTGARMMDYMYTVNPGGPTGYYAGLIIATVVAIFANVLSWQRKEGYP